MKLILPYLRVYRKYEEFAPRKMDQAVREALECSTQHPCYMEISDDSKHCYLFFRERQIYSSGTVQNSQFSEATIKDFFLTTSQLPSPFAACYEVNAKILHSLLILFQKKPSLMMLTSLVDLDEVLDKIEEEKKSCIVCASQDHFLAVLRYEKGQVTALCHEQSLPTPQERTFREDFLVKIYTLSAEKPFKITVYEDLLVKYSADAKMVAEDYDGDITDLYLSKPPVVTLFFKGREIGHWTLDKPIFNIGRTADNDIVIDNLAVSRLHAVLEREKGDYYIRDCDSLNGTLLNDSRVGRSKIKDGDEIVIGKHTLKVQNQFGIEMTANQDIAPFDQTVMIGPGQKAPQPIPAGHPSKNGPRLVEKTRSGEVVIELSKPIYVLGKDEGADVSLDGFLIAKQHAEIVQQAGGYVIRHLSGLRKVSVGGKPVKECVLKNNDEIKIGNKEFVFQE